MKTNKVVVWSLVAAGVALTGLFAYSLLKKPATVNRPLISGSAIQGIVDGISSLFGKKDVSPTTGYSVDAGVNYYNTGLGPTYIDPAFPFQEVQEG